MEFGDSIAAYTNAVQWLTDFSLVLLLLFYTSAVFANKPHVCVSKYVSDLYSAKISEKNQGT